MPYKSDFSTVSVLNAIRIAAAAIVIVVPCFDYRRANTSI